MHIYFLCPSPLTNPYSVPVRGLLTQDGTNNAQADRIATKISTVAAIDAIVRIACKRFHGFSNSALACAISFPELLLALNFASLSFKGTFPTIVSANETAMYRAEEVKISANRIKFESLCINAANGNNMTGPIKLTKKKGF